jgi:hypothetical protein
MQYYKGKKFMHTQYLIHIALPRQQLLRERAHVLRYTYIACLVLLATSVSSQQRPITAMAFTRGIQVHLSVTVLCPDGDS